MNFISISTRQLSSLSFLLAKNISTEGIILVPSTLAFQKTQSCHYSNLTKHSQDDIKSPNFEEATFRGMASHFPCLDRLKKNEPKVVRGVMGIYGEEVKGYNLYKHQSPFHMKHGGVLPELEIAYEEWGQLNEDKSNAVLIHTGLSASSHAHSTKVNPSPGWWEAFIGPGAPLDTNKFYVLCTNVLGGCYGSTGPSSLNPINGKEYGTMFPLITVEDMVAAQFLLLDHLGIEKIHASVGSSLGGMQALMAGALYPDRVQRITSISSCVQSHPSSIALRYIQRRVIMADPNWSNGHYYGVTFPVMGMQHARELGTISYRSGPEWESRFGNKRASPDKTPDFCPDFLIETYLERQGEKFCTSYDPNSLLYISKAMDLFDMGDNFPSLIEGVARVKCPVLVLGVTTDILFPVQQQREMVELLKQAGNTEVTYYELNSIFGHDTFLLDKNNVGAAIKGHLEL